MPPIEQTMRAWPARLLVAVSVAVSTVATACASRHADELPAGPEPSASAVAAKLGDTLRVMRGQGGAVDGGRLAIRFDSAGADSRCPARVQCVWQGDVAAMLGVTAGGATTALTLHTGVEPRAATVAGYRIELLTVDPYPGTEPPNARLAQTVVLRVTRP